MRKAIQLLYVVVWLRRRRRRRKGRVHKPCLAREADTWSASVESCGESVMLRLPEEDTVLSCWGESSREMISAPWSVRALADSRKLSLWLSICIGSDVQLNRVFKRLHATVSESGRMSQHPLVDNCGAAGLQSSCFYVFPGRVEVTARLTYYRLLIPVSCSGLTSHNQTTNTGFLISEI